jgi:hypothetical protein
MGFSSTSSIAPINVKNKPNFEYDELVSQNQLLRNTINTNKNKNTTYNQKYNYQSGDIHFLQTMNKYLFFAYYLAIIVFCYFFIFDKNYGIYLKIAIVIFVGGYPYFFNMARSYVVNFVYYLYSIINFNAYENKY